MAHELLFAFFQLPSKALKLSTEGCFSIRHQFILFHTDVLLDALTQFGEHSLKLCITWIEPAQRGNTGFHLLVLL
jgi:hypothetical protein